MATSSETRVVPPWRAPGSTAWFTLVLLGVFAAFRFWQALLPPQGVCGRTRTVTKASRGSLCSAQASGQAPASSPLLWKLTGTPTSFVVGQTLLAVVAWSFLSITVGSLTKGGWRRLLAIAAVLAFACTLPVSEWDWSVLSESLALSALAAMFAFAILYARTAKHDDAVGLVCASAVFALARDEDIWTIR